MLVERVELRDFRSHTRAALELIGGITVIHGPNGVGKTNLLEGLFCGCTGSGVRARRDGEMVRTEADAATVDVFTSTAGCAHHLRVVVSRSEGKSMTLDGRRVDRLKGGVDRPLTVVFMADRLALVKGPPGVRRGHIDELSAALWPSRKDDRADYARALQQRNALLGAIRAGRAGRASMPAWTRGLAERGLRVCEGRMRAAEDIAAALADRGAHLGLAGKLTLTYRPRVCANDVASFTAELDRHLERDIALGYSTVGPHRDELSLRLGGRDLRAYGSQGEQRLALLALLLAERDTMEQSRGSLALMLLDDVMSELDPGRRACLVEELSAAGQTVITSADPEHVPQPRSGGFVRVPMEARGQLLEVAA
ncbi:MAG: DNA replication/repair protein RecF [Solirubrobacteraceae bacterium]